MNKETFDRGAIRRYSSDNLFQALRESEAEVSVKILGEYIPKKEEDKPMGAVKDMLDNWIAALEEDTDIKEPIIDEFYRYTYMGNIECFSDLEARIADGTYSPRAGDVWRIMTSGGKDAAGFPIEAGDLVALKYRIFGIGYGWQAVEYDPEEGIVRIKEEEDTQMNEKKIVFISQPMNGLSDEDILAAREEAIQDIYSILAEKGIDKESIVIADSYFDDYTVAELIEDSANIPLSYLGEAIKVLAKSHFAYFCDGWEETRGCKIEHLCAAAYGVEIIKD